MNSDPQSLAVVDRDPAQLPATLTKIATAIAVASTPSEIKHIIAITEAAVAFANRFYKDQRDVIQRAKVLVLEAQRRLGQMLATAPKDRGGRPKKTGSDVEPVSVTLADLGIDKKTSMRAQQLARLPQEKFDQVKAGVIPVAKAIAAQRPKARAARSRRTEVVEQCRAVLHSEGSTLLIVAMRAALKAMPDADAEIDDPANTLATARKLQDAVQELVGRLERQGAGLRREPAEAGR